jgi:hypothetical protein
MGLDAFAEAGGADGATPLNAVPSFLQNLAFGGFNVPQVGQVTDPGIEA